MEKFRKVVSLTRAQRVTEGAGVKLNRAVGFGDEYEYDPFLLLDDIHSTEPSDYLAGFPWHPHRGIETVTYLLRGAVEHGDSIGNGGVIETGEVQWMTAGSGIVHQEMPRLTHGEFRGIQLWVNLPAIHKMMKPRYRGIAAADLPVVTNGDGVEVRVIAGVYGDSIGPAQELVRDPTYLDVTLAPGAVFTHPFADGHTVFAYVLEGNGAFGDDHPAGYGNVALFDREGGAFHAEASEDPFRFLVFSGDPLREPIAWRGPIVMNTQEELLTAFRELEKGNFIKS